MNIQSIKSRLHLFSSREWLVITLAVAIVTVGTFLVGLRVVHQNALDDFEKQSETVLGEVGKTVVELEGVLKSLLGMHYASDEFAGLDINAFADQLRFFSPFVNSIGMFGVVDEALRSDFEEAAAIYKDQRFDIHTYSAAGVFERHVSARKYLPIISVEPFNEIGHDSLGLDLASDPDIAAVMQDSKRSGQGAIVKVPEGWRISGDSLLLQPVYFSESPPQTIEERNDLYAGGVWVAIDADSLLKPMNTESSTDIEISVDGNSGYSRVLLRQYTDLKTKWTNWEFGQSVSEDAWSLGQTKLTATIKENLVSAPRQLQAALAGSMISFILSVSVTGFVYQRREVKEERQKLLDAISLERENAERTLDSISDAVIAADSQLNITFANPAAENWFSLNENCIGSPLISLLQLEAVDVAGFASLDWTSLCETVREKGKHILDVGLQRATGISPIFQLTFSSMRISANESTGFILVLQDVSKERELRAELEHQAHHDPLTGVFNRFFFDMQLTNLALDDSADEQQHALCYLDLDQFKIVNDTCGHPAGDRLLCELTQALLRKIRKDDVLARLGGDEFGIILRNISEVDAKTVAQKIFSWFETAIFEHEEKVFPIRCSMGLVSFTSGKAELSKIMASADIACYSAKASGRNSLVVFSESDQAMADHKEDMNWLPRLERALVNNEFRLVAQPIASLADKHMNYEIKHYELLLRLIDDAGNEIAPMRFIQAAERFDLMRSIDRWVIDHGCQLVSEGVGLLPADCSFSLNLSGQSAADPELLNFIADRIDHYQLDPQYLWFEITETAAISHFDNAVKLFEGLQKLGAKVALDDFGSGLSSFAYLRNLPVDLLKIDGQFVRDVATSYAAREMVRAMHHVASAMGLQTVAEFVENQDVFDILQEMNIDFAQGYLIGKPVNFKSILEQQGNEKRVA
ncbi:EAL domain-containing protein [bacterium]|nr:EAL domain-containing protein [bacterium]